MSDERDWASPVIDSEVASVKDSRRAVAIKRRTDGAEVQLALVIDECEHSFTTVAVDRVPGSAERADPVVRHRTDSIDGQPETNAGHVRLVEGTATSDLAGTRCCSAS